MLNPRLSLILPNGRRFEFLVISFNVLLFLKFLAKVNSVPFNSSFINCYLSPFSFSSSPLLLLLLLLLSVSCPRSFEKLLHYHLSVSFRLLSSDFNQLNPLDCNCLNP